VSPESLRTRRRKTPQSDERKTVKVGANCIVTPVEWSFKETLGRVKEAGYEAIEVMAHPESRRLRR